MAVENDLVLEKIDQYKKRSRAAFLLCAESLVGLELLGLKAGLVVKAWELNSGALVASQAKAAGLTSQDVSFTVPDGADYPPCSCAPPEKAKAVRGTPRKN